MARRLRLALPGYPHHITQRGNNRQEIFLSDDDRREYLRLLARHSLTEGLSIAGFCLMTNHVHLIGVPAAAPSLRRTMQRVQAEYAQNFNRRERRSGHLWQNRYFSCVLDNYHYATALRYVEQNPVRAGIVAAPQDWEWSSAQDHLGLRRVGPIPLLAWDLTFEPSQWAEYLGVEAESATQALRLATRNGWPLGGAELQAAARQQSPRAVCPERGGRPMGAWVG